MKKNLLIPFVLFLSYLNVFSQIDSTFFLSGQHAEMMLSGFGFNNSGGSSVFNHCSGISTDGSRLFLADRWNNRILIWNSIPSSNVAPDLVLGQSDFNTNGPGSTLDKMNWPGSVSVSSNGKLVVADSYNNRVLVWNSIPTQNGQAADFAITTNITWPWGVWTDGQKLIISSMEGVKIWNSFPSSNFQSADILLTANNEFGTPRTITSNGDFLMVGDHNAKTTNGPQGNFVWNAFPQSNDMYSYFTTDPYDKNFAWLQGAITPNNSLIALGRKLHIWNNLPTTSTQKPDLSLNFNFNGGDGSDMAIAGNQLFISSMNDNRVFGFNTMPASASDEPDFVLGSTDINTNSLKTNYFITNPVPVSDGTHLFVSSDFDRTLSVWGQLPTTTATPPDTVISLTEAPWDNELKGDTLVAAGKKSISIWTSLPLNGEQPDYTIQDHIGSTYFNEIKGVAFDKHYFYIADQQGYLYIWNGFPTSSNYADPFITLSVVSPSKLHSDGTYLSLTEMEGNPRRALIYEVATLATDTNPYKIITGQNNYDLNLPAHTITANGHVFLANTIHNVIYAWKDIKDAGDYSKVIVLGSLKEIETTPQISDSTFFWPAALSFDGTHLWVGEIKFSGRLLRYTIPSELPPVTSQVEETSQNNYTIKIYPNPAKEQITIDLPTNLNEEIRISLFDYTGKQIVSQKFSTCNSLSVNLNHLSAGIYLLKVSSPSSLYSEKILIDK